MEQTTFPKAVESLRQQLKARGGYPAIAKATGISLSWFYQFARGELNNPTVETLDKISTYLKSPPAG